MIISYYLFLVKQEKPDISVRVKRELSISPVPTSSGRTTPDNEIQPPLKKGREHEADHRGFRTRNRNRKRDFSRKTEVIKERETDETIIARRQENFKIETKKPYLLSFHFMKKFC